MHDHRHYIRSHPKTTMIRSLESSRHTRKSSHDVRAALFTRWMRTFSGRPASSLKLILRQCPPPIPSIMHVSWQAPWNGSPALTRSRRVPHCVLRLPSQNLHVCDSGQPQMVNIIERCLNRLVQYPSWLKAESLSCKIIHTVRTRTVLVVVVQ